MPPYLTQPPDPNPKTPRLKVPAGACDTHIHLFGPATEFAFDPANSYVSADALPETYIRLQETLGLARAVIVSGAGYGRDTRHLLHTLSRFPDRFRGVALVPDDVDAAEIARMDALGVRGIRFFSPKRGAQLPRIDAKLAALVHDRGWHVQFYPHADDLADFIPQLLALPNPIVFDHFAGIAAERGIEQPAFQALLKLVDTGRVWVKLSGPMRCMPGDFPYAAVTPMAKALVAAAPERLLWGSDWPHVNMNGRGMPNDGDLLDLFETWVPDAATRARILVDNPCRLYGFPTPSPEKSA